MKSLNLLSGRRQRKVDVTAETSFIVTVGEMRHERRKFFTIFVDPKGKRHTGYWRNEPRVYRSPREGGKLPPWNLGDFYGLQQKNAEILADLLDEQKGNDAKDAHQPHLPQEQDTADPHGTRLGKEEDAKDAHQTHLPQEQDTTDAHDIRLGKEKTYIERAVEKHAVKKEDAED